MKHEFLLAEANHFALRTSQSVHLYTIMILIPDLLRSLLWSCQLFSPPRRPDRQTDICRLCMELLSCSCWRRALISSHPWPNLLFISSLENCLCPSLSLTCQFSFADCLHTSWHLVSTLAAELHIYTNIQYFYIIYDFGSFTFHAVFTLWCR